MLLEGGLLAAGGRDAFACFQIDFTNAVAAAVSVSPRRIRVLDSGPPLESMVSARKHVPREDNGGGVLAFLAEELTPMDPLPDRQEDQAQVVRILALIREPCGPAEADEPSALQALEAVGRQLADLTSGLQSALGPWLGSEGKPARLWCPTDEVRRGGLRPSRLRRGGRNIGMAASWRPSGPPLS